LDATPATVRITKLAVPEPAGSVQTTRALGLAPSVRVGAVQTTPLTVTLYTEVEIPKLPPDTVRIPPPTAKEFVAVRPVRTGAAYENGKVAKRLTTVTFNKELPAPAGAEQVSWVPPVTPSKTQLAPPIVTEGETPKLVPDTVTVKPPRVTAVDEPVLTDVMVGAP